MMTFFNNMTITSRLIIGAAIPAMAFVVLAGIEVIQSYEKKVELAHVVELATVAPTISDTIHALQEERGASAGYLSSKGKAFGQILPQKRATTTDRITAMKAALTNLDYDYYGPELKLKIDRAVSNIDRLDSVRRTVNGLSISAAESARLFTSSIGLLFFALEEIGNQNHDDEITKRLAAYHSFLHAKEHAGLERAMGAAGFANGKFEGVIYRKFVRQIEAQKVLLRTFRSFASKDDVAALEQVQSSGTFQEVVRMRDIVFAGNDAVTNSGIEPEIWFSKISQKITKMKSFGDGVSSALRATAETKAASMSRKFLWLLGSICFVGMVMISMTAMMFRSIVPPITGVATMMSEMANGEYSREVTGTDRRDEIGVMSKALQILRQGALDKIALEKNADEQREASDRSRREQTEHTEFVVRTVAQALGELARGNLTTRIDVELGEGYEALKNDFNSAIEQLQNTVSNVVSGADGIMSGTREISQASDDLASRTEGQAATLEETAAAVSDITSNVANTADGADRAQKVVAASTLEAEKGGDVVNSAIDAMSDIEKSSNEIGDIIGVIDEIAFQTNLLALNAGVEAARAGEAGRGFAVVASEVRALAQRSADAARQIKDLISTSRAQVDRGVELVKMTGEALREIVSGVTEINEVVTEIASGSKVQSANLQQVNAAVSQLDQVTQENAAMVEQSTAAARTLASQTNELSSLVAKFKLSDVDQPAGRETNAADSRNSNALQLGSGGNEVPSKISIPACSVINDLQHDASASLNGSSADGWKEF